MVLKNRGTRVGNFVLQYLLASNIREYDGRSRQENLKTGAGDGRGINRNLDDMRAHK